MKLTTKYRGREVDFPAKQINNAAAKLSPRNLQRMSQFAEQEMRKYLIAVTDALIARHSTPYRHGQRLSTLQKRSGAGLKSVKNFLVRRVADEVTGHVRLNKYMDMHEHGGWIRAKNAQYLTIPLPAALNANGTPKKPRARDWENTFVSRSKRGNLIIFQKRGRRVIPLYVLKKKVRIPARLGLRKELSKRRPAMRSAILARIRELAFDQTRNRRGRR